MSRLEHLYWQAANVVVRAVLRSALHRLGSRHTLLLEFSGRRSGKQYVLPVTYWQPNPNELVCLTSASWSTWWRNLDDAAVTVVLRRAARSGRSHLVTGRDLRRDLVRGFLARNPKAERHFGTSDPLALADDPQIRVISIFLAP